MLLKICGVTEASELDLLDLTGVDLAGVWAAVPQGARNIPTERLAALAMRRTARTEVVAVTVASNFDVLRGLVRNSGVRKLQLHGFTPPPVLARLKDAFGAE